MSSKIALMVCTHALGGMRSVVEGYERDGVFAKWNFQSLWTHQEGSVVTRVFVAGKAYLHLLALLISRRVSFMHIHAAMRGSFWRKSFFAATARSFGVPTIIHLHGSEMETFYNSLNTSKRSAVRHSLEHAESVVVLSNSWQEFVSKIAPKARITILNNYVRLPDIHHASDHHQKFEVLFLGVLGHRKGIYDLLECWPDVVALLPEAKLLVGGNGEIEQAQARAIQLGISGSVDFLGWVAGDRKNELLSQCDAFVLPSYNEGLPMSVLEAMSWSKPVVTTRVGGIPELITDGHDGLLIEPGDKGALSKCLIQLAQDKAFREQLGQSGRNRIKDNFSDLSILPKLNKLYREISGL